MISADEKGRIKQYQAAAGLTDAEYRQILYEVTGMRSTTDPKFSHAMFLRVMKTLEATIEHRINDPMFNSQLSTLPARSGRGLASEGGNSQPRQPRWPMIRGKVAQPRYWRDQKGGVSGPSAAEKFAEPKTDAKIEEMCVEMMTFGEKYGRAYSLAIIQNATDKTDLSECDARDKIKAMAAIERTLRWLKRRTVSRQDAKTPSPSELCGSAPLREIPGERPF